MKWNCAVSPTVAVLLVAAAACGRESLPPKSLLDARDDFYRVKGGPAAEVVPADVHRAELALRRAEAAFQQDPDSASTDDLALIADRLALIAEAHALEIRAQQSERAARSELDATRAGGPQSAQGQIHQAQEALGRTQMQLEDEQQSGDPAQKPRTIQGENPGDSLKDARETISKIAPVKDDGRGMVITLQGESLFPVAKSDLRPGAMPKLDQIASALKGKTELITIFGYTDNAGSYEDNTLLSQRRAEAVRSYLVSKGLPRDRVRARGEGPEEPVADNGSLQGRSRNRRIEIVAKPKASAADRAPMRPQGGNLAR